MRGIMRRLIGRGGPTPASRLKGIYEGADYLEAYSQHTDLRVGENPQDAVGGMWEEIGQLQFDFLISRKMQPQHNMLDIGCGTLRGGHRSIAYLDARNYAGIDISPKAIEFAKGFVSKEGLSDKEPRLLVNQKKDLKFLEFPNDKFDYILAQSVFTHLKPDHINECFENIGKIMSKTSAFYFTYRKEDTPRQVGCKGFRYPFAFFESLAAKHGFNLQDCSKDYAHPRDQQMLELTIK